MFCLKSTIVCADITSHLILWLEFDFNPTHLRVSCSCVCTEGTATCTGLDFVLVLPFTFHYIFPIPEFILNITFCPQQTEVCLFEVWDIPWQGTSSLLSQKCQPKGQPVSTHSSSHSTIVLLNMYWNSLSSAEPQQEETNEVTEASTRQPLEVQIWCHDLDEE